MFLRSQKSFVVSPPFDECEPACLPSCMSQGIHHILASCLLRHSTDNPLDPLHPHLELHVQEVVSHQVVVALLKHG